MPINSFSIGRDCQLVVMGPQGRVDLTYVTGFESRQMTQSVRLDRLDGVPMGAELPKGWEAGAVYQYVTEVDGSVSTYQYSGVVFKLVNAGTWKGDSTVKQKLEFFATQRQRV